mgnify:FL=1
MSDKFAEGLTNRLAAYSQEVSSISALQDKGTAQLAPLRIRLQKLLDTIPLSVQSEGLNILDLQARLRGRKGRAPHIGELGAAMRGLGWQRRRRWSNETTAFSSRWHPKETKR